MQSARVGSGKAIVVAVIGALAALLLVPALASAHLERPSYWPDPAPDTSVKPAAGGEVPKQRSLQSAVRGQGPGKVRVVCQGKRGKKSMRKLRAAVKKSRTGGFRIRPSQPKQKLKRKRAKLLVKWNKKLRRKCKYKSIQEAVFDSGNNDRVVIMPGRYTEKKSRQQPVNDPGVPG